MDYTIRPCETMNELAEVVRIQKEIWGYAEHELYPLRLFINLGKIGGHVLGAFTPVGDLVGFVASMPAWHGEQRYYHSLSLGVLRGHENQGLGRALKLAQREAALRAGIECVEWTFDPLREKNAYFNIVRLGAIACRYLPDYYGQVDSRLQGGLPSDRLVAEWWLKSQRVRRAIRGLPPRSEWKFDPRRRKRIYKRIKPAADIWIPASIGRLMVKNPAKVLTLQSDVREHLQESFAQGLAITGFVRGEKGGHYLLDPFEIK